MTNKQTIDSIVSELTKKIHTVDLGKETSDLEFMLYEALERVFVLGSDNK